MSLNKLEYALLDETGECLDYYLEVAGTKQIMQDIAAIKMKAMCSTDAGKLKHMIQELIDKF